MVLEGEDFPAVYVNCRQVFTGAVQNYIPGVRLTGSLRIALAITKDRKLRIAKATVHVSNPDLVALRLPVPGEAVQRVRGYVDGHVRREVPAA